MAGLKEEIFELLSPKASELGLELLEIQWRKESGKRYLRLIIDKKGGVSMDDCEKLSRIADPLIDEHFDIKEAYYFEVQSPGLDRPLKTAADFLRYQGTEVIISLYQKQDGKKKIEGTLLDNNEQGLELQVNEEKEFFPFTSIAHVKRKIEF